MAAEESLQQPQQEPGITTVAPPPQQILPEASDPQLPEYNTTTICTVPQGLAGVGDMGVREGGACMPMMGSCGFEAAASDGVYPALSGGCVVGGAGVCGSVGGGMEFPGYGTGTGIANGIPGCGIVGTPMGLFCGESGFSVLGGADAACLLGPLDQFNQFQLTEMLSQVQNYLLHHCSISPEQLQLALQQLNSAVPSEAPPLNPMVQSTVELQSNAADGFLGTTPCMSIAWGRRFKIAQEPQETQRKSYKNENRYILPNPLVIAWTGQPQSNVEGTVTVSLAGETGEELSQELQDILDGPSKTKTLDDDHKALFPLKMLATSAEARYRLIFRVRYQLDSSGEWFDEELITKSFRVESNRKKNAYDRPKVFKMKPSEGYCGSEVDVWIWGAKFNTDKANMRVMFGNEYANIHESGGTILGCTAPPRPGLGHDVTVRVNVANVHPVQGIMWAQDYMAYTYLASQQTNLL
ncbi:hypothetical protein Pelo_12144 [Pelomyxa schiedti]|nr:hypothetical protein Pelo_12144 [Pelomyxa schiedti]